VHGGLELLHRNVGCGTGSLAFALSQNTKLKRISAIDFSPIYFQHAEHLNNDPRIQFKVGDAFALPFEDASFDHAASPLVLAFIPEVGVAVREMRRVIRPGGIVAASMWDARGGLTFARMFWDAAAMLDPSAVERRSKAYTRPMTRAGDLAPAWQAAGLHDVVDDMITIRMDFACFEDYWRPMEAKTDSTPSMSTHSRLKQEASYEKHSDWRILMVKLTGERSYAATAWAVKGRRSNSATVHPRGRVGPHQITRTLTRSPAVLLRLGNLIQASPVRGDDVRWSPE
jgi:SAM-dependent methyltransferase